MKVMYQNLYQKQGLPKSMVDCQVVFHVLTELFLVFFPLQLIIFCDAHQFKVAVNGVHTLEYKHRFKQLEQINLLEVTGDVQLLDVRRW